MNEILTIEPRLIEELGQKDVITDMHQTLMDIAYDNLRSKEDPDNPGRYNVDGWRQGRCWSHTLLTWSAEQDLGELVKFAVLIGKYNQQVCNGGHFQYWYNDYASAYHNDEDINLHVQLEKLFENFIDDAQEILNLSEEDKAAIYEVQKCLVAFREQLELYSKTPITYLIADGDGELYDSDEDECNNNAGTPTKWCEDHWDMTDSRYYKVNKKLLEILEEYFEEKIKLYKES